MNKTKGQILSKLRANGNITDEEYKVLKGEPCKTGHWIDTNTEQEWYDKEFVCSECKGHMLGTSEFCPYCGARMESEEE